MPQIITLTTILGHLGTLGGPRGAKILKWPCRGVIWKIGYDELRDHVESLFESVPENLTLHRSKKIFFRFYHLIEEIRSFPTMYNTWGCLWGQIDETKHFLQKSGLKTPILAATVLDHPTSKRAETHNF